MSGAYLKGLLHDGTEREYTFRIAQNNKCFTEKISAIVQDLGFKAWTYEEGDRGVFITEFSKKAVENQKIETRDQKRDYI